VFDQSFFQFPAWLRLIRGASFVFLLSSIVLTGRADCPACAEFRAGIPWGILSNSPVSEASGVASSSRNEGVLWTHNDGGGQRIFAMGTNGSYLASFNFQNTVADFEDIAVGPGPVAGRSYLYLGDIGGYSGADVVRNSVRVLRVPEPLVSTAWAGNPRAFDLGQIDSFNLVYPDGSYNSEALLFDPVSLNFYVVTKQDGTARVYRGNVNDATNGATVQMVFVRSLEFGDVSGGSISADGYQVVLRREEVAVLWSRCDGETVGTAMGRAPQVIPVVGPPLEPNGEAVAFLQDGTGYVTMSEGANPVIYFFRSICPQLPRFTLLLADRTNFAGGTVHFKSQAVGFPSPTYRWFFNDRLIPGQTGNDLLLSPLNLTNSGRYKITASNSLGVASSLAFLDVSSKPHLLITEVQSSTAPSPKVPTADWWELTSFQSESVSLAGWRFNDNAGGLTNAYVFPANIEIKGGESIIFVESLTPDAFRLWWGAENLPATLQIITYSSSGLSFGASGDGVRLWDNLATSPNALVASVDFGQAENGVTFTYDAVSGLFGEKSVPGINGAFRAASSTNDVGSPGRIGATLVAPQLTILRSGQKIRVQFEAVIGKRYRLESRNDLRTGAWETVEETTPATQNAALFFEFLPGAPLRFHRMAVIE